MCDDKYPWYLASNLCVSVVNFIKKQCVEINEIKFFKIYDCAKNTSTGNVGTGTLSTYGYLSYQ